MYALQQLPHGGGAAPASGSGSVTAVGESGDAIRCCRWQRTKGHGGNRYRQLRCYRLYLLLRRAAVTLFDGG